jgi:membrane-associated protease RseP (regulator of RpoE activity)
VSDTAIAVSQRIGIALLLALMALVMYNDIFRLAAGKVLP